VSLLPTLRHRTVRDLGMSSAHVRQQNLKVLDLEFTFKLLFRGHQRVPRICVMLGAFQRIADSRTSRPEANRNCPTAQCIKHIIQPQSPPQSLSHGQVPVGSWRVLAVVTAVGGLLPGLFQLCLNQVHVLCTVCGAYVCLCVLQAPLCWCLVSAQHLAPCWVSMEDCGSDMVHRALHCMVALTW